MDYFMLQQQPPPTPPPEETTWLLGTEYERRTSAYMKSESGVMMVEGELAAVNLGLMWARAGSDLLKEAEAKARALWAGAQKKWNGLRTQKGYQAHQLLIQADFARPGRAQVMRPIVSSPFPRWITNWETQLGGKTLFGVALPEEKAILAESFACNVWEGCWGTEYSDSLCAWALTKGQAMAAGSGESPSGGSGESPSWPTGRLQAAGELVASALPHLKESGVPMDVAFRAMGSAITAIHRSRGRATFAAQWPARHLALAFLHGALKAEWTYRGESPCVVANLASALRALQLRFGFEEAHHAKMAIAFDCVFSDTALVESAELAGLP